MKFFERWWNHVSTRRQLFQFWRLTTKILRDFLELVIILSTVVLVILSILFIEDTLKSNTVWGEIFIRSIEKSRILGTFESISIVTALVIYVRRGKKQSHYEAWQVIDAAQGLDISYARIRALEDLAKDGVSLKGLSLPKANLEQITLVDINLKEANFKGAKLQEANLKGSAFELTQFQDANLSKANLQESVFLLAQMQQVNLSSANLQYADLQGVNLLEANLQRADLQGAYLFGNLQGVNFEEANLHHAVLEGSYLKDANFRSANLQFANLREANLQGVNFEAANLQGVNFQNVKGLNPTQVQAGYCWEQARYSKELLDQLGLL
ncbi:MAG: pentapeptide repeat-containing protein [Microcoleaceae cyanobacterium]